MHRDLSYATCATRRSGLHISVFAASTLWSINSTILYYNSQTCKFLPRRNPTLFSYSPWKDTTTTSFSILLKDWNYKTLALILETLTNSSNTFYVSMQEANRILINIQQIKAAAYTELGNWVWYSKTLVVPGHWFWLLPAWSVAPVDRVAWWRKCIVFRGLERGKKCGRCNFL